MKTNYIKVLFIARKFPPSVGGMENYAYDLSSALEKKVDLIKITWGKSNIWLPFVFPMFFVKACYHLLTNRDIDVIHIQDAVQAPLGWLLSRIFRKPFLIIAHGLDITYDNWFYQHVNIYFVKKADAIISISSATNQKVIEAGYDRSRARTIFIGTIDNYGVGLKHDKAKLLEELGLGNQNILLTTGRFVKRKGVAWFIEKVLPELVKRNNNLIYLVAGEGADRHNIENAISISRMSKNVKLLGRVSDELRTNLYLSSDVFVMPNIKVEGDMEGFGLVAQEAATAELPVVGSNMEGIADAIVNGKNGFLVETGSIKGYVEKINELLADDIKRKSFGKKARKYTLEKYNWGNIAEKYIEVYKEII
jgi:phosphatidylinositol alpha-1,6-mannosyltransferase